MNETDPKNLIYKLSDVLTVIKGYLINENTEARAAVTVIEEALSLVNDLDNFFEGRNI